jgi:hypothetical protein
MNVRIPEASPSSRPAAVVGSASSSSRTSEWRAVHGGPDGPAPHYCSLQRSMQAADGRERVRRLGPSLFRALSLSLGGRQPQTKEIDPDATRQHGADQRPAPAIEKPRRRRRRRCTEGTMLKRTPAPRRAHVVRFGGTRVGARTHPTASAAQDLSVLTGTIAFALASLRAETRAQRRSAASLRSLPALPGAALFPTPQAARAHGRDVVLAAGSWQPSARKLMPRRHSHPYDSSRDQSGTTQPPSDGSCSSAGPPQRQLSAESDDAIPCCRRSGSCGAASGGTTSNPAGVIVVVARSRRIPKARWIDVSDSPRAPTPKSPSASVPSPRNPPPPTALRTPRTVHPAGVGSCPLRRTAMITPSEQAEGAVGQGQKRGGKKICLRGDAPSRGLTHEGASLAAMLCRWGLLHWRFRQLQPRKSKYRDRALELLVLVAAQQDAYQVIPNWSQIPTSSWTTPHLQPSHDGHDSQAARIPEEGNVQSLDKASTMDSVEVLLQTAAEFRKRQPIDEAELLVLENCCVVMGVALLFSSQNFEGLCRVAFD